MEAVEERRANPGGYFETLEGTEEVPQGILDIVVPGKARNRLQTAGYIVDRNGAVKNSWVKNTRGRMLSSSDFVILEDGPNAAADNPLGGIFRISRKPNPKNGTVTISVREWTSDSNRVMDASKVSDLYGERSTRFTLTAEEAADDALIADRVRAEFLGKQLVLLRGLSNLQ